MNATELLTQQHRETEELFERFGQADGAEERQEIARTTIQELRLHTMIEEEVLYPAMREQGGELADQVLEDIEEHHAVEVLLDELEGMKPTDERFAAKFTVMSELVLHHVEEEEQEQFPLLGEQFGQEKLDRLGEQMLERYEQLKADAEVSGLTKEELYRQAQELDIAGRAEMSKRELAEAVKAAS